MITGHRAITAIAAAGVVLVVIGVIVGSPRVAVEGAYFGAPGGGFSGVFRQSSPSLLDPADGNLWLGAGIVVLLAAAVGAIRALRQAPAPAPDASNR